MLERLINNLFYVVDRCVSLWNGRNKKGYAIGFHIISGRIYIKKGHFTDTN